MGFIYDLVHDLNMLEKATEATEDITEEVGANTDAIMGRESGVSTTARKSTQNDDNEIDPDVDNILKDDNDSPGSNDLSETEPTDEPKDDDTSAPDENESDPLNSDSPEDMNSMDNPDNMNDPLDGSNNEDDVESYRKRKLHGLYVALHETLDTDIRLIAEFIPRLSDTDVLHTLNNVNNNLIQCKEYAYSILTEEYNNTEYVVLLKKYVALNRVYDLSIKVLEKYFDYKRNEKK